MPLVVILALLVPATAAAQGKPSAPAESGRWIVVYDRAEVASVDRETDALERRRGFRSRLRFRRAIEGFAARLTPEQVRALRTDPDVEAVVPDRPVRVRALRPAAANEIVPTGIARVGLGRPEAVHEAADSGVAVVDTGVDLEHPDLNVADGTNCVTPGTPADDVDGHGTHVAGTVAAENDGLGVVGAAPGTRIHAVKVLNDEGEGAISQIVCGIDWVVTNAAARGIRVINMSLGTLGDNNRNCGVRSSDGAFVDPLHAAICRATAAGILTVVAAGNGDPVTGVGWNMSESPPDVPGTYPEVLTVTAMADGDGRPGGQGAPGPGCGGGQTDDTAARFSNFTTVPAEAAHTIAAPGVCILSTLPLEQGGYRSLTGTSMAAPHVAGWAALCLGEAGVPGPCAGMSPAQIVERLRTDAALFSAAGPEAGFVGDPAVPIGSRYYGFLLRPPGPDTALTAAPPAVSSDATPTFGFSSPGQGVTFECGVNDNPWSACGPPHTTAPLGDGEHVFLVRAVDPLGNPDTTPATATFTVDTTRPRVSYSTASRQRIATVARKGMRVSVKCTEACRLAASLAISGRVAGTKKGGLAPGRRSLTIKLKSAVRRQLARKRTAVVQLRLVATDAAGNARTVEKSVRLVR